MTTALTNSVNTWWAQIGERIGKDEMFKHMDRYGFDQKPQLDYPGFQLAASDGRGGMWWRQNTRSGCSSLMRSNSSRIASGQP